jgi:hypothetical protein
MAEDFAEVGRMNVIERILARCVEVGQCLEWTGALNACGAMYISEKNKKLLVRRVMWEDKHGPVPAGKMVSCSCRNPKCVLHLQAITVSQRNKRIAEAGWWSTPAFAAKVSHGRRKNSKLPDEGVAQLRAHVGNVAEKAEELGISESYAHMLRRGEFRKDFSNPFGAMLTAKPAEPRARARV